MWDILLAEPTWKFEIFDLLATLTISFDQVHDTIQAAKIHDKCHSTADTLQELCLWFCFLVWLA